MTNQPKKKKINKQQSNWQQFSYQLINFYQSIYTTTLEQKTNEEMKKMRTGINNL